MSNCTLTGNAAQKGGAAAGGTLNNCILTGNSAVYGGGASSACCLFGVIILPGTLNSCSLSENRADFGGGVYECALSNCTLSGNFAADCGGGADKAALRDCTLSTNSAGRTGGAVHGSIVDNCVLLGNSAFEGGGAGGHYNPMGPSSLSILNNCVLTGNRATEGGGTDRYCSLTNCVLSANFAESLGGGAYAGTLNNCKLVGNWALRDGGGTFGGDLIHCTLSSNRAGAFGGGTVLGTLKHCTLVDNSAAIGGGADSATLNDCTLTGNAAADRGGGAYRSTLTNCTLTGNSAGSYGGGVVIGAMNSCIVYYNSAGVSDPNYSFSTLNFSCTTPLPSDGVGNISDEPAFVDLAGGNLRLETNSPCIDAGDFNLEPGNSDLDGRPRIVGSAVDIGAYEFQGAGMGRFIAWLQQYGLHTDGSDDTTDSDADRLNNWQEWRCGTDPTNVLSVLRLLTPMPVGSDFVLRWESVPGRKYSLARSTNLVAAPFVPVAANIIGQTGTTTYTDANAAGRGPCFYRVGVE
jgi:hypothetical protein